MKSPPIPINDKARLETLSQYNVLDTPAELVFDELTELAAEICNAPVATITLIDEDREWYKSKIGIEDTQAPRNISFCAHAILQDELMIVPDTLKDDRFSNNPFVLEDPPLRFYAGAPLITPAGHVIGTLCVIDHVPRKLNNHQKNALRILANCVVIQLESRRKTTEILENRTALLHSRSELEKRVMERTSELNRINHQLQEEITRRKQKEKAHQIESAILSNMTEGIILSSVSNGIIIHTNSQFEKIFGYDSGELVGKHVSILNAPTDVEPEETAKYIINILNETGEWNGEIKNIKKDGTIIWCKASVSTFDFSGYGKVWLAVHKDITDIKRAEKDLRFASFAMDHAADSIYWIRPDGSIQYVNNSACKSLGYTFEELLSMSIPDIDPDITIDDWLRNWEMIKKNKTACFEARHRTKDGRIFPIEITASYLLFEGNQYNCSFVHDITERKQAEETLKFTQFVIDHFTDAAFWTGQDGKFIYVNDAACNSLGYSKEELLNMTVYDINPDLSGVGWVDYWEKTRHQKFSSIETRHRRKDGKIFPVAIRSNHLEYQGKELRCSFARDITEQKAAEKALQRSEKHLRFLYEENPSMYFTITPDGILQSVNKFGANELGYKVDELKGKSISEVFSESEYALVKNHLQKCLDNPGQLHEWESQKKCKNGETIWVEESARAVETPDGKTAVLIVCRNINAQKIAEQRLKQKVNQDEFIADFGRYILTQKNLEYIFKFAVSGIANILNVEFTKILELLPDDNMFILRFGIGWKDGYINRITVGTGIDSQAGYTLNCKKPVVVNNLHEESRFSGPDLLLDHGIVSGISVVIEGRDISYGVLGAHSRQYRNYNQEDIDFMQTIANMLGEAIEFYRAEEALKFSHRALRSLNQCNHSLIYATDEQSLLEEVCSIIVKTGNYRLAWVGYPRHDDLKTVAPVAKAGHDKGYLDSIVVSWSENKYGRGPTGKAIRNGKYSLINNVLFDTDFKPWRNLATAQGFASVIALPLIFNNVIIGALTIYATEENAFNNEEVALLTNLANNLAFGITALRREKQRKQTENEIIKSRGQLRNLATRLQAIREEERTLISREIHDELGQTLTGLKMDLSWIREHIPGDLKKLPARIDAMISLVDTKLDDTRKLAFRLRPAILDDLGLEAAIECEVQEFAERVNFDCSLNFSNEDLDQNHERDTALFRILQESLTNIARHAKASLVDVALSTSNSNLILTIKDNGIGIDENKLMSSDSLGLIGMRERVDVLNGQIYFKNIEEGGTQVTVKIPYTAN